ncbi:MAG: MFS transporter [Clostridia bacterium]|jgi:MFS family permease|nr:MFS transporter [Clostridia bacterium]
MIQTKTNVSIVFRAILLTIGASFIYAMNSSVRNNYGIMLDSIIDNAGISFTSISFVLAVGQLMFGLVQPLFGIMAAKKGSLSVLVTGVLLMLAGIILIPFSKSAFSLMLCLGFILPAGTGALSYGVIVGAITPKLPLRAVSTVSGIVNASIGIGNIVMSPVINSLIKAGGLMQGMMTLSLPALLMLPISIFLGSKAGPIPEAVGTAPPAQPQTEKIDIKALFRTALKSRTYTYLMIGFFTCGFHMALITNHLPTQFLSFGFSSESAAYAFSIYGFTTIAGSILSGSLSDRFKMKNVLGFFYALRPLTILAFLILPKTVLVLTIFTALLGFSGAATVPPTAGIINRIYGAKSIAALFGFVFFIHQIGGFLGAWLGGICFEMTNSYTVMWLADILLSALAAGVSFSIKESKAGSCHST